MGLICCLESYIDFFVFDMLIYNYCFIIFFVISILGEFSVIVYRYVFFKESVDKVFL